MGYIYDIKSGKSHNPGRYSRWRAITLTSVYLLMGVHIAHWKISGKTLAPLELNEVMVTLELGVLTAGFLFMAVAVLGTLIFGRFFCSWGCHILALEDLCAWLLGKVGIKPKPVRSRILLFVPPAALFYMFFWPQLSRVIEGRPMPEITVAEDADGWASFVTDDFWRNLPPIGVALVTFLVCGFVIVYVMGSRSFCRYGCPYGALFALADRLAPGRLVSREGCTACGKCTASCQSDVRVHEELAAYGTVMDPACMKDLDCIAVCPEGAIGYGLSKPSLFRNRQVEGAPKKRYDFHLWEELLIGVVFLVTLFTFRGLYGLVPFLLTLAVSAILGYMTIVALRLRSERSVRFVNMVWKSKGRITWQGRVAIVCLGLLALMTVHSATYRLAMWRGETEYARFLAGESSSRSLALSRLQLVHRLQLLPTPGLEHALARLHLAGPTPVDAVPFLVRSLEQGAESVHHQAEDHFNLSLLLSMHSPKTELALFHARSAMELSAEDPEIWNHQGFLLMRLGEMEEAESSFRQAIVLAEDYAQPHFNLGRLLDATGDTAAAEVELHKAGRLDPNIAAALEGGLLD